MTHRDRAGEIVAWLDLRARLRGIRLPADVRRDLVDAIEENLDEAVSLYATALDGAAALHPDLTPRQRAVVTLFEAGIDIRDEQG